MRKAILILLVMVFTVSCADDQISIGGQEHPFVIISIEASGDDMARYKSDNGTLVMPVGLYNLNDTIDFAYASAMQRAWGIMSKPKFSVMSVQDTSQTGLDVPFMRVDTVVMPDGINMRYVPGSGKLEMFFDYGTLFNIKNEKKTE